MSPGRSHTAVTLVVALLAGACSGATTPRNTPAMVTSPASAGPPSPAPAPSFDDPIGVAVDGQGNVWVANYRSSTVQMFAGEDVHASTSPSHLDPQVVLSGLAGPNQLEFDRRGWLWLVQWDDDSIVAYQPSQLLRSGSPKPAVRISGGRLGSPTDLAFDRSGDLWVANQRSGDIVEYAKGSLGLGGSLRPDVVLEPAGGEGNVPLALSFDREGWLWVTSYYDDLLMAFAPDQLVKSGAPDPRVRVELTGGSGPIGVTVDEQDRVWVAEALGDAVVAFPARSMRSGSPPAAITISGPGLDMPHSITFASDGAWVPCLGDVVLRYGSDQIAETYQGPPEQILT
jgi:sugar lactone lactonase YvrE